MTRKLFSLFFYIVSSCCILFAVLAVFASFIIRDLTYYTQLTLKQLEENTGYHITIDNIDWSIAPGAGVRIDNLTVTESGASAPLLKCNKVNILTALFPLFRKRFVVSKIIFTDPRITFIRTSDAVWHSPTFPSISNRGREPGSIFDVSIALKRIFIGNATIFIRDDFLKRTVTFDNLTSALSFNRKTRRYSITGRLQQPGAMTSGSVAFDGSFTFTSPAKQFQHITGSLNLSLINIFAEPLIHMLPPQIIIPDIASLFNGTASVTLSPDHILSTAGNFSTQNFLLRQDNATVESFGPLAVHFKASGDERLQGSAAVTVTSSDAVTIDSTLTLNRTSNNALHLAVSAEARQCSIPSLKQLFFSHTAWREQFSPLLNRVQSGDIVLSSFTASGKLQEFFKGEFQNCRSVVKFKNAYIKLVDTLPSLHCTSGSASLDNDTLTGSIAAQLFGSDNHTIDFMVSSLLHDPSATVQITSALLAQHLQKLFGAFPANSPMNHISFTDGLATARTVVHYQQNCLLQADIDLTKTSYQLAGPITKPAGLSNSLSFILFKPSSSAADADANTPLFFNFKLSDSLVLNGTVSFTKEPFWGGTYTFNSFDLTSCRYPALSPSLSITGLISGTGSFSFPVSASTKCPLAGSLMIDNFALYDSDNATEIMGLSLAAIMTDTSIYLLHCGAHFGITTGTLSGSLSSLLPMHGNLKILADIFDIDDFIKTVEHIQSRLQSKDPVFIAPVNSDKNPFLDTSLDMNFSLRKLNFMNWDFYNGTCRYTYKNGVMRWDNVTVTGGNGIINGFVVYDFSDPSSKTLILAPANSSSDFIWAIPSMRKKQTITGRMNLSGEFKSTFTGKSEIGPNMAGAFHVTVTKGVIRKFTVLSKILTMLNIPYFAMLKADDIFENGMPFDTITSDFIMQHAIMKTENLVLRGPAMNLTAVGDINLLNEHVDLIVGAQILETIGRILGTIPIAGELVTGKDKSLTIGYFHVSGPYHDASVTPMPVKSISGPVLRIFRSILDIPRDLFSSESDNRTQIIKSPKTQR